MAPKSTNRAAGLACAALLLVGGSSLLGACSTSSPAEAESLPAPIVEQPADEQEPQEEGSAMGEAGPGPLTQATPAIILEPPEPQPTATHVTPQLLLPMEQLNILQPGPGSQVISPLRLVGYGGPSFGQRVDVRLLGEDGRIISEKTTHLFSYPGNAGRFTADVPFEIPWVAEAARLEVTTFDFETGRLDQLTTVDLVLLSAGSPRIEEVVEGPEKLAILSPIEGYAIGGGLAIIKGAGWLNAEVPLLLEIFDHRGDRLAAAEVMIEAPQAGMLGTFHVEVPYSVPYSLWGRIAISEPSTDIPGLIHYSSIKILLRP